MTPDDTYASPAVRALVHLHEPHMREFVDVWKQAKASGLALPKTKDPDYDSLDALLRHVLHSAGLYMTRLCGALNLPDPGIKPVPEAEHMAAEVDSYLEHVLAQWKHPLRTVSEEAAEVAAYPSYSGDLITPDCALEHAVMHPIRHTYQLRNLMAR